MAYVAFTRAEEHLVLFHAASRMTFGRTETAMPSRFLSDIPEEDIHRTYGQAGHAGFGGESGYGESGYGRSRGAGGRLAFSRSAGRGSFGGARSGGGFGSRADDPYASFRASRAKASQASGESYVDMDDYADLDPSEAFAPGRRVFHAKFGVGRIKSVEGTPHDPAVVVYFEERGITKRLKASFLRPA